MFRSLFFGASVLCLAALTASAQNPSPAAGAAQTKPVTEGGTQNAPPPAGKAQDTRVPVRRPAGGGDQGPTFDPATVERGKNIFQSNCSFCHGANAKGGESGPDLLRSVLVLHDENGDKIGPVIHNGRIDKGMPKFALSDEQISDISTFLQDRVKAAAMRGTYKILNIVTGDPAKGEAYFNGEGHCSSCHSASGDLAHIASKMDPVEIQQHVVMPRQGRRGNRLGRPDDKQAIAVTVTLPSGESVHGTLLHVDDFTVELNDDQGEFHSFGRQGDVPKVEMKDPLQAHTDMLMKYSDADIHNLTAYLVTLK